MHIKDLHIDIELDGKALAAIHGGCFSETAEACGDSGYPALPTFGGSWFKNRSDIMDYIGNIKPEMPGYELNPDTPMYQNLDGKGAILSAKEAGLA